MARVPECHLGNRGPTVYLGGGYCAIGGHAQDYLCEVSQFSNTVLMCVMNPVDCSLSVFSLYFSRFNVYAAD